MPFTAPGLSSGGGSPTFATLVAAQKAAKANRYVRLRPKGMAPPTRKQSLVISFHTLLVSLECRIYLQPQSISKNLWRTLVPEVHIYEFFLGLGR
jgi:hypothetical protein